MKRTGKDERIGVLEAMARLGFTEYEAKTYLSLLKNSPATGYQISKNTGIPRSMVYEALGRLSNKDAVMSLPQGDTTRYAPVPANVLLDGLRHKYEDALDVAQALLTLEQTDPLMDQVWNMDRWDATMTRAREMIRTAQEEILASIDDLALIDLISHLKEANDRGVSIRFVLSGEATVNFGQVVRHPRTESDLQGTGRILVLVTDASQCIVGGTDPGETCIWTGNRHVVFIARQFIWQEILTQRVLERLGQEVIEILSDEERKALLGEP